jgi:hypothetical protein
MMFASCLSLGTGINTFVKESVNERGNKKAMLFLKVSSLSADSYQVTICDKDHQLDEDEVGNTFTVDTNYDSTFLNNTSINFIWVSNDTLQIDYDRKLRTFIQEKNVDDVKILYKAR